MTPSVRRFGTLVAAGLLAVSACGEDPPPAPPKEVRYASDGTSAARLGRPRNPKNLLLVCVDTLRADALAPWGGPPERMPETSRLLGTGVSFRQAASASPWTGPSVATILTGLLPSRHGAAEFADDLRLIDAVPTLAEILRAHGWHTRAYTGGGWVSDSNGMLQGFEVARHPFSFGAGGIPMAGMPAHMVDRPWFFFLHTYEAHDPYGAPALGPGLQWPKADATALAEVEREHARDGVRAHARRFLVDAAVRDALFEGEEGARRVLAVQRWFEEGFARDPEGPAFAREMRAAYDAGVRRLDAALGAFFAEAERNGILRNTVVVFVSDHGEGFGEHGTMHHGRRLYDELVRVPLWIRAPGWAPRAVDESVSLCDVVPTVLDLLGLPVPEGSDGRSLVPLVAKGGPGHVAISEERKNEAETGMDVDEALVSARDARWKFVWTRDLRSGATRQERYDLRADPGETAPLEQDPAWPPAFAEAVKAIRLRR